ncbi:hypothetical protein [Inquilinus limosus]|nr:hypothetical protein [Inquilinus limosus]
MRRASALIRHRQFFAQRIQVAAGGALVLPVGGQAAYEGQEPFTPPWAA